MTVPDQKRKKAADNLVTEEAIPSPRQAVVPAPAPPKYDYRLRGLDLKAPDLVEVQPRMVRKAHPSRRRRRRRLIFQWVVVLALVAASAIALRVSVIQPYSVRSTSMSPTLPAGSGVLVMRPKFLTGSISTGDIIVFQRPKQFSCSAAGGDSKDLVKRVIGLPGQTITSTGTQITIDGKVLKEKGWFNRKVGQLGSSQITETVVPAGSYFVMGDNRNDPCDSRAFGTIPASSLVGKVVATTTRNGHPHVHIF